MFGAKASGTLWVVGVRLCGIGEVVETRGALKSEGGKKKSKESGGSDKHAAARAGRWRDKMEVEETRITLNYFIVQYI